MTGIGTLAVAASLAAASTSLGAALIFDDFNEPSLGQSATILSPTGATGPVSSTATGLLNTIGGARTIYVGTTTGDGRSAISAGANVSPDLFTIANDTVGIDGYGGVIWDGGTPGGLNYDMSSCTFVRWDYDSDQITTYSLTLQTYGGATHTESITEGPGAFRSASVWLAPFVAAGVNLADIDSIELRADSEPGGDVAIRLVECDIPEPAITGAAYAALAGLGMVIRRFRKS